MGYSQVECLWNVLRYFSPVFPFSRRNETDFFLAHDNLLFVVKKKIANLSSFAPRREKEQRKSLALKLTTPDTGKI